MKGNSKSPIVIVCGAGYVSGKEVMALELAGGLVRNGERVLFVISSWNDGDFAKRLKGAELHARTMALGFISATLTRQCLKMTLEQIWNLPPLLFEYRRLLRWLNPYAVVHTNWHHLLLLLPFVHAHRDIFWLHEYVPNRLHYRFVFNLLARRLRNFICVSRSVAESVKKLGIDEDKIRVVHNGVTRPISEPRVEESAVFRIGIVGQVGVWKGHDDLIEAFALVHGKHPTSELHIFGRGDGTYTKQLKHKSVGLGIADSIKWHGFIKDTQEIYSRLDICVVPSRSQDPLPTVAIEAGFSGLPVIATRSGGLPEIVEHEINGLLVEAGRPLEIADALCRLIEDRHLRLNLSNNAICCALQRFGSERFVTEFLPLLQAH
jgi:glycosyltransferase involved in cell wall biosynthesis